MADAPFAAPLPSRLLLDRLRLQDGRPRIEDLFRQLLRLFEAEGLQGPPNADHLWLMLREGAIVLRGCDADSGRLAAIATVTPVLTLTGRIGLIRHFVVAKHYAPDDAALAFHAGPILRELARRAREAEIDQLELRDQRIRPAAIETGFIGADHHELVLPLQG